MTLNKNIKENDMPNEIIQDSCDHMISHTLPPKEDKSFKRPVLSREEADHHGDDDVQAAFKTYMRCGDDQLLKTMQYKALSTVSGPEGGYAVPTDVGAMISMDLTRLSPLRQIANVMEISTEGIDILIDVKEADAGWVSETAGRPETTVPQFRKKHINVHEMYASPRATQKLLDDSHIDIESWLVGRVSQKMATMESEAFINGDGKTCPRGILTYPLVEKREMDDEKFQELCTGVQGDFQETGGADILIEAVNQLSTQDLQGACWLMSRSAYARIRKLKDQFGNYLWMPGLDGGHRGTLFGYPVFICDAMPELSVGKDATAIIFGNFKRAYQIIDRNREKLSVLRDEFTHKPFVEFYVTSRVGGDVVNFGALKFISFKASN